MFARHWRRRPSPALLQIRKIVTFCSAVGQKYTQASANAEKWQSMGKYCSVVAFLTELPTSICKYWLMDGLPMVASGILPVVAGGGLLATSQLVDKLQSSPSYAPSGIPLPPLYCLCLQNIALKTTTAILYSEDTHWWRTRSLTFDFIKSPTDDQIYGQYDQSVAMASRFSLYQTLNAQFKDSSSTPVISNNLFPSRDASQ